MAAGTVTFKVTDKSGNTQSVPLPYTTTVPATRYGAFCGYFNKAQNPNETDAQRRARVTAAFGGKLGIERQYPGSGTSAPTTPVGCPTILSWDWNADMAGVVAGNYDSQIIQAAQNLPSDRVIYASPLQHEPWLHINAGDYTLAQYQQAWQRSVPLFRANAPSNVKITLIQDGYTVQGVNSAAWRPIYPGDNMVDVLAWDCYWITGGPRVTADGVYGNCLRETQLKGKEFVVAETSFGAPGPTGGSGWTDSQVTTLTNNAIAYLDGKATFVSWFESNKEDGNWLIEGIHPTAQSAWSTACSR